MGADVLGLATEVLDLLDSKEAGCCLFLGGMPESATIPLRCTAKRSPPSPFDSFCRAGSPRFRAFSTIS